VREQVQAVRTASGPIEQAASITGWRWHPAYALGNERLSCSICILASKNDLLNGIEFHPDYYRQLVQLELDSGFSFRHGLWQASLRPDLLAEAPRAVFASMKRTKESANPVLRTASQPVQLRFEELFIQLEG
jgi:hypothetical protein